MSWLTYATAKIDKVGNDFFKTPIVFYAYLEICNGRNHVVGVDNPILCRRQMNVVFNSANVYLSRVGNPFSMNFKLSLLLIQMLFKP